MSQMIKTSLIVNGKRQTVTALPDTPLLWVLRDDLKLTGTKFGCGAGQCGACMVQKAWLAEQVPQCGYCQSGQIMRAADLLKTNPHPTREQIVEHMSTNICRCGTYARIVKAVERAAREA